MTAVDIPRYIARDKRPGADVIKLQRSGPPGTAFKDRQKALWYLIHFVGDVHMPLHVGDDSDAGGNGKKVRFFAPSSRSNPGHVTNLHSLWDILLEIRLQKIRTTLGPRSSVKPKRPPGAPERLNPGLLRATRSQKRRFIPRCGRVMIL